MKLIDFIMTKVIAFTVFSGCLITSAVAYSPPENVLNASGVEAVSQQKPEGIVIKGTVRDASGEPMIGVSVKSVSNPNVGAITDVNGQFSVTLSSANEKLSFSYLGYVTKEVVPGSLRTLEVALEEDAFMLEEMVVIGFGKQKKESVVGAITAINPKDLRVPSSSLSAAFAGKLAGVVSVQRSGEPGADGANFWIRGISTFASNTSPLIFIDGVEVSTDDMNALSPEVIEGFSILKDATATALYGARGANGVILITTRQGQKNDRTRINVRVEGQMTQPTQTINLADGVTYMEMFNEGRTTRGGDVNFSQEKIDNTRAGANPLIFPNIDWMETLFKDWSYNQTANLNVTGGGSRVSYFINAQGNFDDGMLKNDPNNTFNNNIRQQRYSFQGNVAADLTNTTRVSLRLNSQILEYGGSRIGSAAIYEELFESPSVLFPAYWPNTIDVDHILFGNQEGGPRPSYGANLWRNVYSQMVRGYSERSENTNIVTFDVDQKLDFLTKGLSFQGIVSFKNWTRTTVTREFTPTFYEKGEYSQNPDGSWQYELNPALNQGTTALSYSYASAGDRYLNIQTSLHYARTFNEKHNVGGLLAFLQRDYHNNVPSSYYASLPTRNQGFAGRITYGYDSRYLVETNFGYNGSENFEDGKRYGFFPSFALGYNISNESFWEPISRKINNLKIRGSWGIVGNSSTDEAGRFPYLTFVNLSGRSFTVGDNWNTTKSGGTVTRYGADGASWEEGTKLNLGLDFTLFNSLSVVLDVFREKRQGIFMRYNTLPIESGISGDNIPYANLGKVNNEGMDISVDYNKIFSNGLYVNFRGNVTYAKNTLIDRDEPDLPFEYQSDLNKPLNRNKGLVSLGLFKDQADIDNSPTQTYSPVLPGDIKYADLNGDGQIDDNDRTQLGDPTIPQLVYGFGISSSYKGFDASIFFQGVGKTSIMMGDIHPFNVQGSQLYQFIADDYWSEKNPNPNAAYPRLITESAPGSHNNHQQSDYWLRDGSFLRLKNVEVGYSYKFARIYLSGQNLFVLSSFKHWDPEMGGIDGSHGYISGRARGLQYPTLRTVSAGIQFNF